MREYNVRNEVEMLDVYYGSRRTWRNNDLPLDMDCQMANPSYIVFSWYCDENERLIEFQSKRVDDYRVGKLISAKMHSL